MRGVDLWGEEGAVVSTCMLGGSALLGQDGALYIGATSDHQVQLWSIRGPQ